MSSWYRPARGARSDAIDSASPGGRRQAISSTFDVHPIDGRSVAVTPPNALLEVRRHPILIQGWVAEVAELVERSRR